MQYYSLLVVSISFQLIVSLNGVCLMKLLKVLNLPSQIKHLKNINNSIQYLCEKYAIEKKYSSLRKFLFSNIHIVFAFQQCQPIY